MARPFGAAHLWSEFSIPNHFARTPLKLRM
jgi:hypothetical protein